MLRGTIYLEIRGGDAGVEAGVSELTEYDLGTVLSAADGKEAEAQPVLLGQPVLSPIGRCPEEIAPARRLGDDGPIQLLGPGHPPGVDRLRRKGATMEEISVTKKEIERLSHQEAFIKKLSKTQPFSRLLHRLSVIMNAQTWLTRLMVDTTAEDKDKVLEMKLYGFSLSNEDLGEFLTRLSEDRLFEDVILKYARENEIKDLFKKRKSAVNVIQFQINLNIVNPEK